MSEHARARAPALQGRGGFIGSPPLTLAALRGRLVLLDFWTFCCVNCLHVLDEVAELERRFGDDLVVIGVHSPKFPNEQDHAAVERAVERLGVRHAVLDDPERATWQAYGVHAWPTLVLVDPEGYIALQMSGEGRGDKLAGAIETLLAAHRARGTLVNGPLQISSAAVAARPPTGLRFPGKLALDHAAGQIAVSDTGHNRILLLTLDGQHVATIGSGLPAHADGDYGAAAFRSPQGVCFYDGALWVADTGNHRLRRVDLRARRVTTIARQLRSPWDLEPYRGSLVIAMAGSHQLWGYEPVGGRFGLVAGSGREGLLDGPTSDSELAQPSGVSALGALLGFVDAETSSLRVMAPFEDGGLGVATLVGRGLFDFGDADGAASDARLQHPLGLTAVPDGWVVADTYNHRLRRFSVQTGIVQTLAGSSPGFADGPGSEARFDEPSGAVRIDGHVLVADTNNHALRRIELATGLVTTMMLAGVAPPGRQPAILPEAILAAGADVELSVRLQAPAGTAPDATAAAPLRVRVTAEPPGLLRGPAESSGNVLPLALRVATAHGEGTLRIDVRGAFCDVADGAGAACRLAEAAYVLPVRLAPDGARVLDVA